MFPTVEVRWFFRGVVPSDIWEWFSTHGCDWEEQPPRTDKYLRAIEGDALGVKLREGRIEIKQRYGQQAILRFGKHTEGCVERWCKWSFELAEKNSDATELIGTSPRWIGVKKERKLRIFRVADDQTMENVSGWGAIDRGCTWEIVKVKVDGTENGWWSVGFEAFGKESEFWDTLLMVSNRFFSMAKAPTFRVEDSYSYPRWLQQE
jgi:hypothetical protein